VYVLCAAILLGYWLICYVFGAPGDPYSLQGYFGTAVEMKIFGAAHLYHGEGVAFDPEGIASTAPAIVQVIIGYFTGKYIQQKGKSFEMLSNLFMAGSVLIFVGYIWDMFFPVNKKIWTSSYVIFSSGIALMVLSALIFITEFKKQARSMEPLLRCVWQKSIVLFFSQWFFTAHSFSYTHKRNSAQHHYLSLTIWMVL